MAHRQNGAMVVGMLGRALFALVCLVIAAGIALPLYPSGVGTPRPGADPVVRASDSLIAACEDCPIPAERGDSDCPSEQLVQATFVAVEDEFGLSVTVVIRPQPSGRETLPAKLPAI
jgi:hypothetical protein